jgi:Protein of unknown function (DUF4229)
MNPAIKYTLGRIGLFLVVMLALWPLNLDILLKLMIAVIVSAGLSIFVLRRWRAEITEQVAGAVERRRAEKERLQSALGGRDTTRAQGAEAAQARDGQVAAEPDAQSGGASPR